MGCRKVFTDRRVFMFNNTLMEVSSFKAYISWITQITCKRINNALLFNIFLTCFYEMFYHNFLSLNFECMPKKKFSGKYIYMLYLCLSNIQSCSLLPQVSMSITSCSKINVKCGFAVCTGNQRYLFKNRKSPGFTEGCWSSHWVKSNFSQGNCERLDMVAVL